MAIICRSVAQTDELRQVGNVPAAIWGMGEQEAIPYHLLVAFQHAGGLVLGAFDGERAVGLAVGFLGTREGKLLHWSHMTGMLPEYQGRGIGSQLKWLQRQLVLEQGYDCIAWTYDPLQRGNAAFNIHRLGCVCNRYRKNVYGEMSDRINMGLTSDRFEVRWWLNSERVLQRTDGPPALPVDIKDIHCALVMLDDKSPGEIHWPDNHHKTLVEIPDNLSVLQQTQPPSVMLWRARTRETFTRLFDEGFMVVDFVSCTQNDEKRYWYVLTREK